MNEPSAQKPRKVLVNFTMASLGLMAATMLSNLVIIRWLEPEETGVWQTLVLAQSYMAFAQLGFFNGLNREFPFWVGRGDSDKAHRMAATTLTQSLFCALFSFLIFGGALLYFGDERTWLLGLTAMGVMTSAGFYRDYLAATYRTSQAFNALAGVHWSHALMLIVTVPLVALWGFDGLCLRLIILGAVVPFLMHRTRPVNVTPSWDWGCVRELLSAGAPLLALSYLITLANGFDRVLLLAHVGVLGVGLFAPAIAVKNGIQALPVAINQFISPRLSQTLGERGDPRALWRTSWMATGATCLVMVPVIAIGWFAIPPLVEAFFPKYTQAIYPAQLLLLSGLFTGISAGTAVLASLKAWVPLGMFSVLNVAAFWFLPSYFMEQGDPLVGVATGWLVARGLLLPAGLILIYFATHRTTPKVST